MRTGNALAILWVGCVCLALVTVSQADFVGAVSEILTDPETASLCGANLGLTVCNVFAQFDEDDDRLLAVGFSDLQVLDGDNEGVFYQHIFGGDVPYSCALLGPFPDLICDSYVALGEKCVGTLATTRDGDFDADEFNNNGHLFGGWFNGNPVNGLGDVANHPDGKIFVLQSAVAVGSRLEGSAIAYWMKIGDPRAYESVMDIVCEAQCPIGCPTDANVDGDTGPFDLATLLAGWGPTFPDNCLDANDDELIDAFDLATLLAAWGPCP